MFDLSVIHRPGMRDGRQDLGRILETMLYYDRVHLVMGVQMFTGLWDILGPDDFGALLRYPSITTTLTPQMLAMKTDARNGIVTHRPVAIKLAGREGKRIPDKDDVGTLVRHIENLPNRPGGTRAQVNNLVKLTKVSRYEKILGSGKDSRIRLASLLKDQETIKLFIRGWGVANGETINEVALSIANISVIELGDEFMITSTVSLSQMIPNWDPKNSWGTILGNIQDYAVDLYLSNAHSADIVTAPEIAEVASARVDISLQRAQRNISQISAFEEMVFYEAHGFADAINDGLISFAEALKVIDQSRRFRTWTKGLAPDSNLIAEYHRAVSRETILQKLPASIARFAIFNGTGVVADAVATGSGLISSAIDTFIVEKVLRGWRPNIFVRNVRKILGKAHKRAIDAADSSD